MVAQGVLPYQLEEETRKTTLTGLGGLPIYLDLAQVVGLRDSIAQHVEARGDSQGWTDAQMLTALILLNLAGGQCVEDLAKLERDDGFALILHRTETFGMPRAERRARERRWRKSTERKVPSVSALRRFLVAFHDADEETLREAGRAFIPTPSAALMGLPKVNRDCLGFLQRHHPEPTATLDMDAMPSRSSEWTTSCCSAHHTFSGWNARNFL